MRCPFVRLLPQFVVMIVAICISCASTFAADQAGEKTAEDDIAPVVGLLELVIDSDEETARKCLDVLTAKVQSRELAGESLASLQKTLDGKLIAIVEQGDKHALFHPAVLLTASWKNAKGIEAARKIFTSSKAMQAQRLSALSAMVVSQDASLIAVLEAALTDKTGNSAEFRGSLLAIVAKLENPQVADVVLKVFEKMEPELQPKAIEILTERPAWGKTLVAAVAAKQLPASLVNANQIAKLLASKDKELSNAAGKIWGSVRTERDPAREQVIVKMRELLAKTPGDAHRGRAVFTKVCSQCHKLHGEGQSVGPDLTSNGRNSYDQLLSNVFDPSLVIGVNYQARTIFTLDGRILTGLVSEDSPVRIVLKAQGGKEEIVPRDEVEEVRVSKLSMMPENLETQLKPQEVADLFAYITLDKPPEDPTARRLPGAPNHPGTVAAAEIPLKIPVRLQSETGSDPKQPVVTTTSTCAPASCQQSCQRCCSRRGRILRIFRRCR